MTVRTEPLERKLPPGRGLQTALPEALTLPSRIALLGPSLAGCPAIRHQVQRGWSRLRHPLLGTFRSGRPPKPSEQFVGLNQTYECCYRGGYGMPQYPSFSI